MYLESTNFLKIFFFRIDIVHGGVDEFLLYGVFCVFFLCFFIGGEGGRAGFERLSWLHGLVLVI